MFKETLKYVPAKIVPAFIGFLSVALYTRLLTPKEYGWYTLVMTVVSTVFSFGFNWIGYVVWRYLPKYKNANLSLFLSTILNTEYFLFIGVSFLGVMGFVFFRNIISARILLLFGLGIIVLIAQALNSIILMILQMDKRSRTYSLFSSAWSVTVFLISLVFLHKFGHGAKEILLGMIISFLLLTVPMLIKIYHEKHLNLFSFSKDILKTVFWFGLPQIGIAGGASILSMADRYLIGVFLGSASVGVYSAAYAVSDYGIQLPFSILLLPAFPQFVLSFESHGEAKTAELLKKVMSLCFLILIPIVFGMTALSQDIGNLIVGKSFRNAFFILPWVSAGSLFLGLSMCVNVPLQLKEKPLIVVYCMMFSAIINVLLNIVLIPRYGIRGGAYATFIAYFVNFLISYKLSAKIFPYAIPWKSLAKVIASAFIMFLILQETQRLLMNNVGTLFIKIIIGAVSYFLMLFILDGYQDLRV